MAVHVCQLRGLVVDQENGAILWREESVETDFREGLHDLFLSSQAVSEKHADRIQRLCGRLDRSDDCGKSVWHAHPHIKPSIDAGGNGTLDVSP